MVKKKSVRKKASRIVKKQSRFDKYLFLSWHQGRTLKNIENIFLLRAKNILIIILAWFASIVLHNAIYGIFGIEEAVFFIVAVIVIPIYFAVSFIYSFIKILRGKDKISIKLVASILVGLAGGFAVNYLGYFRGPWFFAFISLLIAFVVYRIIQFIFKRF
jgi:hypothetical protein